MRVVNARFRRWLEAGVIAFLACGLSVGAAAQHGIEVRRISPELASAAVVRESVASPSPTRQKVAPTPAPTATPSPAPAPAVPADSVRGQILEVFGPSVGPRMVSIFQCESKLNPRATGRAGERGIAQIHPIHRGRIARMGMTWDSMYEVRPNLLVAKALFDERGTRPWSCS